MYRIYCPRDNRQNLLHQSPNKYPIAKIGDIATNLHPCNLQPTRGDLLSSATATLGKERVARLLVISRSCEMDAPGTSYTRDRESEVEATATSSAVESDVLFVLFENN